MRIILCTPEDEAAIWLARTFRDLNVRDVELVTIQQLVFSRSIVHHVTNRGDAGAVQLADGRTLPPEEITAVINRVHHLPTEHLGLARPDDRAYATAELSAFVLAWLNGTGGRVINPARPLSLGGGTLETTTLTHLAGVAGLPTVAWEASTRAGLNTRSRHCSPLHSTIVLDGHCFGAPLPGELQEGCRRLATLAGMPLLQVLLQSSRSSGWRFVGATGAVDFRLGAEALAAFMAAALSS